MSYFYSEEITYCECIMPRQIGWEVMNELGQMECVHFQKNQINYENPYTKSLKRCDEAIAKLKDIIKFIQQIKPNFKLLKVESYKDLLKQFNKNINKQNIHGHLYINEIEDQINSVHDYFSGQRKEVQHQTKDLHGRLLDLAMYLTLLNSQDFKTIIKQKSMLNISSVFDYKCVVINRKDQIALQKGLFRISRGNSWMKVLHFDIEKLKKFCKPEQLMFLQQKIACIFMFQFGQNNILLNKINKYLSCMQAETFALPANKWEGKIIQLEKQIKQIQSLQAMTHDAIERYLHKLYQPYGNSAFSYLTYLQAYALKQRQIYRRLASTNESKNFLHFCIYIPTKQLPLKLNLNEKLPPLTLTPKQPTHMPPTKFSTNQILQIPQQILNTYGVPSYNQFNPATLYIVTFGFFIGVMFGDVGHMLMTIPFLIYFKPNIWAWTVVFFMGYCGLIYNQFFGLNLGLFETCYTFSRQINNGTQMIANKLNNECVYPFGVDSIWKRAQNQMQFTNSLKMKLAVILGVTHMLLGICLKLLNVIRKKNWLSLFTLAIPQLIFMLCTFFYMDFMIIYKWTKEYKGQNLQHAPSIIATMISVYAGFGDAPDLFWPQQRRFQKFLVVTAYLMIPIMLFGIPLGTLLKRRRINMNMIGSDPEIKAFNEIIQQKIDFDGQNKTGSEDGMSDRKDNEYENRMRKNNHQGYSDPHAHEPMQQILVHSFIETIEYVLGTVSNTASYLRLWALSLAHGQLSQVIFDLTLKKMISGGYGMIIGAFFAFIFYYFATFGVLICMDSMECFLHSLRLHWVEFQNKFYEGKGYKFVPFSFKLIHTK